MTKYFYAANAGLFLAVWAVFCLKLERTQPVMYSFFGGQWFSTEIATVIMLGLWAIPALYFALFFATKEK